MNDRTEVAIIAALELEIEPLVAGWNVILGPRYRFYERDRVVAVAGGMGLKAAREIAETGLTFRQPAVVLSVGLAGALRESLPVGTVVVPTKVLSADSNKAFTIEGGEGTLVSTTGVASTAEKQALATKYAADVVDMEAAAVAEVAQQRNVRFLAVKAVSDEPGFEMPPMQRFIDADGEFHTARFAVHAALRPALWPKVAQLKRNTATAVHALCEVLRRIEGAADVERLVRRTKVS